MAAGAYKKWGVAGLTVLILTVSIVGLDKKYPLNLNGKAWSTLVTARDGTPLRAFADATGVWRYPARLSDISPLYLKALITYEDRWFYFHPGVNLVSFIRAAGQNLISGRIISGGSTLTMQVARLLHPGPRTLLGKGYQILRALQLEYHLTKDQILSLYINLAPFGSNIEGVRTASFTYLGKPATELSHAEAALLAVLPQAPSFYRPDRHPERARKARDKVLDRMDRFRAWEKEAITAARQEPVIALRYAAPMIAPLAARRLARNQQDQTKIVSSLDPDLQIHLEQIVEDYVAGLSDDQSGAVLVVNYKTLDILAYIGSADFSSARRKGHVDMVRALRSPGSALKPFLYGLALDEGLIHSQSLLLDTPRYQQDYDPGNFSSGFSGPVSVTKALRLSLNVPAVQLLEAYGPQKFHDRLVHAGARLKLSGSPNLSMVLGGLGTDLESLVRLYTALTRNGITGNPTLLQDAPKAERYLMSAGAAWIIRQILLQPMPGFEGINRLVGSVPMAWKTGTSYGFRDAWALGMMGDYVAGVWVGRPDGSPSPGQYGAVTALPLLHRVFESLPLSGFTTPPPPSIQTARICWPLGTQKTGNPGYCHVEQDAFILNNAVPRTLVPGEDPFNSLLKTVWIDTVGQRARPACGGIEKISIPVWPVSAEPWLPTSWRRERQIPPPSPSCPGMAAFPGNSLQIISISHNSVLTRSPGQDSMPAVKLAAQGGQGNFHWFLNGRPVTKGTTGNIAYITLPPPGVHQLAVADEYGNTDTIRFEVLDGN